MEPRFHFSSANSVTILHVRIFRIIAKPCLVPDPGAERHNARTRQCGAGDLRVTVILTGQDEEKQKKLDPILKSFSLFYQIKCVIYHASLILRVTHTALHTEINKVPSMQRCALSDSVDSVSSVSFCRDTEIVNTSTPAVITPQLMSSCSRAQTGGATQHYRQQSFNLAACWHQSPTPPQQGRGSVVASSVLHADTLVYSDGAALLQVLQEDDPPLT